MKKLSKETKEQLKFLKAFQEELLSQDHDCQAEPRFWVIRDFSEQPVWEGNRSHYVVIFDGDEINAEDFLADFEKVRDAGEEGRKDTIFADYALESMVGFEDCENLEEIVAWLSDVLNVCVELVPVAEVAYLVPNTMFLLKREAKEYLEKYGYNHSKKAHTYAMTAYRSPSVEKLLKILETLPLDALLDEA